MKEIQQAIEKINEWKHTNSKNLLNIREGYFEIYNNCIKYVEDSLGLTTGDEIIINIPSLNIHKEFVYLREAPEISKILDWPRNFRFYLLFHDRNSMSKKDPEGFDLRIEISSNPQLRELGLIYILKIYHRKDNILWKNYSIFNNSYIKRNLNCISVYEANIN